MKDILYCSSENTEETIISPLSPAGCDGVVKPGRIFSVLRAVLWWDLRDVKHRQAVVYIAFHVHLPLWLVSIHVH